MRIVRRPGREAKSQARQVLALGGLFLLLGVSQLAALPGSGDVLRWVRLLSGLALLLAGLLQLRTGLVLRRERRAELLRAVATALSALEQRRRQEQGAGESR